MDENSKPTEPPDVAEIRRQIESLAESCPHWVSFYRKTLGPSGIMQTLTGQQCHESGLYAEILETLADLRGRTKGKPSAVEPERMITIRIPVSLHQSLSTEARKSRVSVNKLAISKLVQPIEPRFVPDDGCLVRGRRSATPR